MKTKKLMAVTAVTAAVLLMFATPAGADPGKRNEKSTTLRGVTTVEVTVSMAEPEAEISPQLVGSGGGYSAEAKLVVAGNGSKFWYSYANTRRTAGPSTYATHVHGALNEYSNKAQWQSDASNVNYQWARSQDKANATSQVGPSPERTAGNKYFWSASGHRFKGGAWTWSPTLDIYRTCSGGHCSAG